MAESLFYQPFKPIAFVRLSEATGDGEAKFCARRTTTSIVNEKVSAYPFSLAFLYFFVVRSLENACGFGKTASF